jgi:Kelch motif
MHARIRTSLHWYLLTTVLLFGTTLEAAAQTPGAFAPTGNMTIPRTMAMATLLRDGRVLIAGGLGIGERTLASAELYDPSNGTFTPTGRMITPRTVYTGTLTLLPDGKVLITGGRSGYGPALVSAELYNPDTGTFFATGNMNTPRFLHTATLLNNGKVLIAGGSDGVSTFLTSAELYDPLTGTFTVTGDMSSPSAGTATLLPDGKILITRSAPWQTHAQVLTDVYDPSTELFSPTGKMVWGQTAPTATLLQNGKVLIAGGDVGDGDGSSPRAELFDSATGTFAATGDMTYGREQHTATLLPDGTVLLTGDHGIGSATAELYNSGTGTFISTGRMSTGREMPTATVLNDGRVLIAGGDQWPTPMAGAEIYTPAVLVPALIVADLQFDQMNVFAEASYSAYISGTNLTSQTFFDVRFIRPGSNESAVVLNWQKGQAASHGVPAGTASGVWTINGVRPHQIETDHTGSFIPVSATITVSP